MPTMVAIVDYGMGNLTSVVNAFRALACNVIVARQPSELLEASHIVLPGVGAFGDGMRNLQKAGWVDALGSEVIRKGKPFLGICLGMQLLSTTGTESGTLDGLNWVPGVVQRMRPSEPQLRIPHIGWNDVQCLRRDGLYGGLEETETFYFVHSFVLCLNDASATSGVCTHGTDFTASIEVDNIRATQFHPEKSQRAGLKVLENFSAMTG